MRRAARRDSNEAAIVEALQQTGWLVAKLLEGRGIPDLVCYNPRLQRTVLVEVKTKAGRLTRDQQAFCGRWPVVVVRSVADAIELGRF